MTGPRWLAEPRFADLVADAIQMGERERRFYTVRAWAVMPNHVHLLILPRAQVPVIVRWLKGSTARRANELLGRNGEPFWQDESYDHWVRDRYELEWIVWYIEQNPVSAGLVSSVEEWPWSSGRGAGRLACPGQAGAPAPR
jgi:REP element-mobilizing transposase RayT